MPSGILCNVTANTIIVVRLSLLFGPSDCSLPTCRWGIRWSSASKNSTPSHNPAKAGKNDNAPIEVDCSIAGIRRLQIDAATITPAANPARQRCTRFPRLFFMKRTQAAPIVVPKKGIRIPRTASICFTLFQFLVAGFLRWKSFVSQRKPRGGKVCSGLSWISAEAKLNLANFSTDE